MPKTWMFRAQGLPEGITLEQLEKLLSERAEETINISQYNYDLSIVRKPPPSRHATCTAIFGFDGTVPSFLQPLVDGILQKITHRHGRDVVEIDSNFYGFTQLYPVEGPVRAE